MLINTFNDGLDNRLMRSSDINETSSRSHLVFTMLLKTKKKGGAAQTSKLVFVDLAGSERVAVINMDFDLYEEALFINESLKYLGFIVRWLASGKPHMDLNFNLNPMTAFIRDCIGDHCNSVFIFNISPSAYDKEATMDTLKFAEHTGKITGKECELPESLTKEFEDRLKAYVEW